MSLEILCTPRFTKAELAELDRLAATYHTTRENLIRTAVRDFVAQCVPTHAATQNATPEKK